MLDIPEAVVLPCEWISETQAFRRFMVAATVVNKHGNADRRKNSTARRGEL
jgi:hypothetical protein